MCYSIPGKIAEINGRIAVVDYFGEKRKAYIDLVDDLKIGDNVYAQGGFVIRTITDQEAKEVLDIWEEIFFKLKEQDKKLASNPKNLYERANAIRQKHQDNSCCVHGIIEFSNYCKENCLYCGIRHDNKKIERYRMEIPDILKAVDEAVAFGFQALVLQSGEDPYYTDEKLVQIIKEIRAAHPVLIFVSVGMRSREVYKGMYDAGARGALLRFETSNQEIFDKMKPQNCHREPAIECHPCESRDLVDSRGSRFRGNDKSKLDQRLDLIRYLKDLGYLIVTGFLIGLPDQKHEDIMRDIAMTNELGAEMFSFGPFIPHPDTPLAKNKAPSKRKTLDSIANTRIMNPDAKILVTTALETLWGLDGAKEGLMAGANSLMINVTPKKYRRLYDIYPERFGTEIDTQEHIDKVISLLRSIGRAPTDLSVN